MVFCCSHMVKKQQQQQQQQQFYPRHGSNDSQAIDKLIFCSLKSPTEHFWKAFWEISHMVMSWAIKWDVCSIVVQVDEVRHSIRYEVAPKWVSVKREHYCKNWVMVGRLGCKESVVRITERLDMASAVYCGQKAASQTNTGLYMYL